MTGPWNSFLRCIMNRKPDWYATRKISWHISVVYCRFLCELQLQALISPIQCCKQDGPQSSSFGKFFCLCSLPRHTSWPVFLWGSRQLLLLKQHLDVVLDLIPQAFCWTHHSFSHPRKDFCLPDCVHVNPAGQYHLYWSYRGAILHAFHILTARTI